MSDKRCETCKHREKCNYPEPLGRDCLGPFGQDLHYLLWEPIELKSEKIDDGNPFNTQVGGDHYKKTDGCPDVAEWCTMQKVEFSEGNVIKYVFRHERKNGFEDIEKAYQYLRFIAWVKYGKTL